MSKIVVVGAGAAGLTAAIAAAGSGGQVVLLNAHPRVGLKILMSGGTRCNVTHREVGERDFHGGSRNVVARILRAFTSEQTIAWFQDELGVPLKLEDTGKYFPVSDDAQSVLDALLAAAMKAGVETRSGARVVRLERSGSCWRAGIQLVKGSAEFGEGTARAGETSFALPAAAPAEWLDADAIVLATGGVSFPRPRSGGPRYAPAAAPGPTPVSPGPPPPPP